MVGAFLGSVLVAPESFLVAPEAPSDEPELNEAPSDDSELLEPPSDEPEFLESELDDEDDESDFSALRRDDDGLSVR